MAANLSKNYRLRHSGSFFLTIPGGDDYLNTRNLTKLRETFTMPDNEKIQFELVPSPPKYWHEGEKGVDLENLTEYLFSEQEYAGPDGPKGKMYMRLEVSKKDRKELPVKFVLSLVDVNEKKKFSAGKCLLRISLWFI